MAINISCPLCSAKIKAPEKALGRKAKCPSCQKTILIQAPAEVGRDGASEIAELTTSASIINRASGPGKKRRGVSLAHVVPAGLLALTLCGFLVRDILSDARPRVEVAVSDDVPEMPEIWKPRETASSFQVAIDDEPEEKTPASTPQPPRFTIQDEPEERLATAPPVPLEVKIQDEPEERTTPGPAPVKVEIKDEPIEESKVPTAVIDPTPRILYRYNPNMRFGVFTTPAAGLAANKQLTYSMDGATNTTVVRVNGQTAELGSAVGKWIEQDAKLPEIAGQKRIGSQSTWAVPAGKGDFIVTQILEIVPSKQPVMVNGRPKRVLDTLLVRYVMQNRDVAVHRAGLRIQVDTLIGQNDGVPFTVPGLSGMVNTFADFQAPNTIPEFLQALEVPNLQSPGTVAHMSLKVGQKIAPPDRVSLTHWPGGSLDWDIPVRHMGLDSAVILYWNERPLKPREHREVGFAYGLGSVSSTEGTGKLGVTLGGSFEPGQEFTVTAYVQDPAAGQSLTLELPSGLERTYGTAKQEVPPASAGREATSIVTWKAKVLRTGEFPIVVHSSTGVSQKKTISIAQAAGVTGGKLVVELDGTFAPGDTFKVLGQVTDPLPGQSLKLTVPAGLEYAAGEQLQIVPPLPDGVKEGKSTVTWKVKVLEAGKFPVRVESSTGVTQTKTITIAPPEKVQGTFAVTLDGSFTPGEVFTVKGVVTDPIEGQHLTLKIPKGLESVAGDPQQTVPPVPADAKEKKSAVTWKVKVGATGKFAVRVQSSTGVTQTKTITIAPPENLAGSFAISFKGDIAPGKVFEVVAQVASAVPDQTLTLQVPAELQCVAGPELKKVPAAAAGEKSTLSWNVKVLQPGKHTVRVQSSTGVTQKKTILIERPDEAAGKFTVALEGSIQPGKEFIVQGIVTNPVVGQKLTLVLPKGLELVKAAAEQAVKALPAGTKEGNSQVAWTVRVASAPLAVGVESGRFPIRVESTTGVARTKTITIKGSSSGPAIFGQ